MSTLQSKVILVAGAGAIGSELAQRYAREGASVVLGDLNLEAAKTVTDGISQRGGRATAVRLDGGDEQSIAAAIALCRDAYGGLDGLHVNFALFEDHEADMGVMELPLSQFDQLMHVNVRGYFLCTRHALPHIIARGGGAVLYTSSIAAYLGGSSRVGYAMGKSAVLALMRHVAARHGADGVRANAVAPGYIKRPGQDDIFGPELIERATRLAMIKSRIGEPADVAALSALLMSDEGSFITGQSIAVDGGMTHRP